MDPVTALAFNQEGGQRIGHRRRGSGKPAGLGDDVDHQVPDAGLRTINQRPNGSFVISLCVGHGFRQSGVRRWGGKSTKRAGRAARGVEACEIDGTGRTARVGRRSHGAGRGCRHSAETGIGKHPVNEAQIIAQSCGRGYSRRVDNCGTGQRLVVPFADQLTEILERPRAAGDVGYGSIGRPVHNSICDSQCRGIAEN